MLRTTISGFFRGGIILIQSFPKNIFYVHREKIRDRGEKSGFNWRVPFIKKIDWRENKLNYFFFGFPGLVLYKTPSPGCFPTDHLLDRPVRTYKRMCSSTSSSNPTCTYKYDVAKNCICS